MTEPLFLVDVAHAIVDGHQSQPILAPLTRTFLPGSFTCIAGPSGVGKTTLMSIIAGVVQPTAGSVRHGTTMVTELSTRARQEWRQSAVALVFQTCRLIDVLTVAEHMALVGGLRGRTSATASGLAWIERLGLGHRLSQRPADLSGGEKQRVALAQALAAAPRLLLADEPTAALDPVNGRAVTEAISDFARETGAVVIAVSHDATMFNAASHRLQLERPVGNQPKFQQETLHEVRN